MLPVVDTRLALAIPGARIYRVFFYISPTEFSLMNDDVLSFVYVDLLYQFLICRLVVRMRTEIGHKIGHFY